MAMAALPIPNILILIPWLKEKDARPLTKEERGGIFRNVVGMFSNNVCRVLNDGIDTTVISAMVAMEGQSVTPLEGIIDKDVDRTISNLTTIGREGMTQTDALILDIMTHKDNL